MVAVLLVASACGGGEGSGLERTGSKEIDATVDRVAIPVAFTITYRVSDRAGDELTERIAVRRPFSSRAPRRASRFGALAVEGEGNVRVLAVPPALGTADLRADAVLDDAADRGLAERRETRQVAHRDCQVYRLGSTASDGTLVPVGTTPGEHADVCVDEQGLVLEEWWVQGGEPLRHRLAVAIDVGAVDDDFMLDGERVPRRPSTDGSVVKTDRVDVEVELPDPPGFRVMGRYAVTAAGVQQPVGAVPEPSTTLVDVWTRGPDFLALDQGRLDIEPAPHAIPIEIPDLGPGELLLDLRATELRFTTATGATVRLYGTLPPGDLLDLAATLRAADAVLPG